MNTRTTLATLLIIGMTLMTFEYAHASWRSHVQSWWDILRGQTNTAVVEVRSDNSAVPLPVPAAPPSEPAQPYTSYGDGTHSVSVSQPGVHQHGARRSRGSGTGTGIMRYDPLPPNIGIDSIRMAASHSAAVAVPFHDRCTQEALALAGFSDCGVYTGLELSGVATARVIVSGPTGTRAHIGSGTVTLRHDFSRVGFYDIEWEATDNAGNTNSGTIPNFIRVVAGPVEWNAGNCLQNYEASCPSTISTTASEARIADGSDTHTSDVQLVDRYGNRVVSVEGIKEVALNFLLQNTVDLDQIAGSGDAVRLLVPETNLDLTGANSGSTKLSETGYQVEAVGGDGAMRLAVRSYAPTSNAYTPIADDGMAVSLTGLAYRVRALGGNSGVGEETRTRNITPLDFRFAPALTATPAALNYNPATSSYEASADAIRNITINAAKRFRINLTNQSSNQAVSAVNLGLVMQPNESDISWKKSGIETAGTTTLSSVQNIQNAVDPTSPLAATAWAAVPAPASSIAANTNTNIRMQSTPELAAGKSTPPSFSTFFRTHVNYVVGGRNPRHKAERLSLGTDEASADADVFNVNIQIIGTTRSEQGINSNLDNSQPATNLGDIFLNEVKTSIDRNVASFIQGAAASRACTSSMVIQSASDWDNLPCLFNNGSIAYFRNASVTFDGPLEHMTLPSGLRTLLVFGGNVFIKDNLVAAGATNHSFGIIALRNDNNDGNPLNDGGNVYLAPHVTNVFGALYAEGSLVSTNHAGAVAEYTGTSCPANGSGGFCDRSSELRNQLLWQGLIISQNTIGGSDKISPECPRYLGALCTNNRALARIFDFNYLRTFHATAGGARAGGLGNDGVDSNPVLPNTPDGTANNHAVVIEYSGSIKNNPPPLFSETSGASSRQSNL